MGKKSYTPATVHRCRERTLALWSSTTVRVGTILQYGVKCATIGQKEVPEEEEAALRWNF